MARLILLGLVGLMVGAYFAIKHLPFWAVALCAVAGLLLLKFVGAYLLKRLFMMPFQAKGRVLRDAAVTVHSIVPTAPPPPPPPDAQKKEEDAPEDPRLRNIEPNPHFPCFYLIDLTIQPQESSGPFRCWNPEEIELIRFGKAYDPDAEDDTRIDGEVVRVEIFHNGSFEIFDGEKEYASNRLRFLTRVRPELRRASFCYYFQTFGDITMPQVSEAGAAPKRAPAAPRGVPARAV